MADSFSVNASLTVKDANQYGHVSVQVTLDKNLQPRVKSLFLNQPFASQIITGNEGHCQLRLSPAATKSSSRAISKFRKFPNPERGLQYRLDLLPFAGHVSTPRSLAVVCRVTHSNDAIINIVIDFTSIRAREFISVKTTTTDLNVRIEVLEKEHAALINRTAEVVQELVELKKEIEKLPIKPVTNGIVISKEVHEFLTIYELSNRVSSLEDIPSKADIESMLRSKFPDWQMTPSNKSTIGYLRQDWVRQWKIRQDLGKR